MDRHGIPTLEGPTRGGPITLTMDAIKSCPGNHQTASNLKQKHLRAVQCAQERDPWSRFKHWKIQMHALRRYSEHFGAISEPERALTEH